MPSAHQGTSSLPKAAPRARLDSWKEIADYLHKGERTAKRWESERSLPVHHVPGGGHGSVYAFTAELDAWLLSEKPKAEASSRDAAEQLESLICPTAGRSPADSVGENSNAFSHLDRGLGPFWRLGPYAFLAVAVLLVLAHFLDLHTGGYTSYLRSLANTTTSEARADSEKKLAHEFYLRGRFEWERRTPESLSRALDYFTQAVIHDPGNAQAYVGLADTYNLLREYTLMPENEAYARAIAAAKKAIALDDSLAEAHRSLAFDEIWGNWDFEAGEREFQRALELNPRDPITHLWFANAFSAPGWYSVCLREINRAQELDPASQAILADKGLMLFHAGRRKEGLELVKQVELTDPNFLSPHRYLASMYLTLRDYPDFLMESDKAAELSHDRVLKETTAAARAGFRRDGERGLWNDLYVSQKKLNGEGKLAATFLAMTCARMGQKKAAVQLLQEDYERHDPKFLLLRDSPDLVTLKDEPEYRDLLSKIHAPSPQSADAYFASTDTPHLKAQ